MKALRGQFLDQFNGHLRLALIHITGLEPAARLVEAEGQREGDGVEHAVRVDRDDAIGQRVHVADVLAGSVVGGLAFLAVPGLVNAEDEGALV